MNRSKLEALTTKGGMYNNKWYQPKREQDTSRCAVNIQKDKLVVYCLGYCNQGLEIANESEELFYAAIEQLATVLVVIRMPQTAIVSSKQVHLELVRKFAA